MHNILIQLWKHNHLFNEEKKSEEKKTLFVTILTLLTMFVEIIAGWFFKSMALFSDGCHMGTHATALGISVVAYILARKYSNDGTFTFGTWKIEILGAYTSSILLGIVGLFVLGISTERFFKPANIQYNSALLVAVIGLIVNLISALILHGNGDRENEQHHDHDYHHTQHEHNEHGGRDFHEDLNLRSAYLHVLADALTSIFAIFALLGAKYLGLNWLDPFMGIVGSILIFRWSIILLKDTSNILLDKEMDIHKSKEITNIMESDGDTKVCDLHMWRVAQNKYAFIISLVATSPLPVDEYKNRVIKLPYIAHLTFEINQCK